MSLYGSVTIPQEAFIKAMNRDVAAPVRCLA
jgi:hypothetical protein